MQSTFFLQAAPNELVQMLPFILIILVFWVFFIRPQNKKQKEQQLWADDLIKGDKVVTASGILGQINKFEDNNIVTLEVSNKTYIRVTRTAISKEMTEAVYGKNEGAKKMGIEKS